MIRTRERGLAVDPLHPVLLMNSSDIYLAKNDFQGWKQQIMRLLDLPEPPLFTFTILSTMHQEYGFLPEALQWAKQRERISIATGTAPDVTKMIFLYESLGMQESADYWLGVHESFTEDPIDLSVTIIDKYISRGQFDQIGPVMDRMFEGMSIDPADPPGDFVADVGFLLSLTGRFDAAIPLLERFLKPGQPIPDRGINVEEISLIHLLAFSYEQSGEEAKAHFLFERTEEMTRKFFALGSFSGHPDNQLLPALNLAARGELSQSAEALRTAFETGWKSYYAERHMPYWRGAWASEEFAPVVADIVASLEQQRAEVEAFEATNDFRAEFETLISDP
jgi:hypothetical protein